MVQGTCSDGYTGGARGDGDASDSGRGRGRRPNGVGDAEVDGYGCVQLRRRWCRGEGMGRVAPRSSYNRDGGYGHDQSKSETSRHRGDNRTAEGGF